MLTVFMQTTKRRMTVMQYLFGGKNRDDKPTADPMVLTHAATSEAADKQLPFRSLFVRPVLVAAGSYATFALIEIAFRTVIPVFYAMPIEMGGLNLDPPTIGIILALLGVSGGILQLIFFAAMFERLGAKTTFFVSVSLCFPMIALFPVINVMAQIHGLSHCVWFLVGLQLTLFNFAGFTFGKLTCLCCNLQLHGSLQTAVTFMYIGAAAPNKSSIGATNGLAQMVVSLMRAIGPATVNSAFSFSIEENFMGGYFVYWVMVAMVCLTLWVGSFLPRDVGKK